MKLNKLYFSNKSEQHLIRYIWLSTGQLYNNMHHTNKNTTNYLARFRNAQKVK